MPSRRVQEELWAILEAMGTAVVLFDRSGLVQMANRAALTCLGIAGFERLVGRRLSDVVPGTETMQEGFGPFSHQQVTLEIHGEERTIGFSCSGTLQQGRRAILFRDVTRLLALEKRRQHAEQLAEVGEVASKLSHEIRNPLANILMGLQTLERQVFLSSEDNEILQRVLGEIRTLERTISSLLDQARWHELEPRLMRVGPLVRDCAESAAPQVRSLNLRLSIEDGPVAVVAVLDEVAMARILGNLIRNAVDASPAGGTVRVGWRELPEAEVSRRFPGFASGVVGVFVEDQGEGVPLELRRSVFEPFVTTKKKGSGLGLTVVAELVRDLGGAVQVAEARAGAGARFEAFFAAGERLRCWEFRDLYPEASLPCRRVQACPGQCPVARAEAGLLCWTIAARNSVLETGDWRVECLGCEVYRNANLAAYEAGIS